MIVDLSVLKNIDFTNPDNLLFLVIILVIALAFILVFLFIIFGAAKATRRMAMHILNVDEKSSRLNKPGNISSSSQMQGSNTTPKQKVVDAGYGVNFSSSKKEAEAEDKKSQKFQRQKSEKEIAEALSKLKPAGGPGEDTMQAKMPSRTGEQEEDKFKAIKIPTPSHGELDVPENSDLHGQSLVYEKGEMDMPGKPGSARSSEEGSIFGDKGEVSRMKLKHEMKVNPKIWQAAKQAGLSLSSVERENLVKEALPQVYGSNISKTDLKGSVRKLNQKMLGAKSSQEHAKLRKEINFFKKIGGLK